MMHDAAHARKNGTPSVFIPRSHTCLLPDMKYCRSFYSQFVLQTDSNTGFIVRQFSRCRFERSNAHAFGIPTVHRRETTPHTVLAVDDFHRCVIVRVGFAYRFHASGRLRYESIPAMRVEIHSCRPLCSSNCALSTSRINQSTVAGSLPAKNQ